MANVKTTSAQWERAKEYYEAGLILREVSEKTKIPIPNISKKAKKDGWQKQTQKQTLIQAAVGVTEAKANLNPIALDVHNELVDDKLHLGRFFACAAVKNVTEAMAAPCGNQADYKSRADTIAKGRDSALGKDPTTSLNVDNSQKTQINSVTWRVRGGE